MRRKVREQENNKEGTRERGGTPRSHPRLFFSAYISLRRPYDLTAGLEKANTFFDYNNLITQLEIIPLFEDGGNIIFGLQY